METTIQKFGFKSIGLALLVACPIAFAQVAPDAGALMRQAEQSLKAAPAPSLQLNRPSIVAAQPKAGEATIQVSRFEFVGNKTLSSEALTQALEPFLNRPLSFTQLQQAADAVASTYREAGWVVRAYLPKQTTQNGVVTIQVTEAVYGKSYLSSPEPDRKSVV